MIVKPKLAFKAGATIILSVVVGFDGGSGINSLDGVRVKSQLRRAHSDYPEAEFNVEISGENVVVLTMPSEVSARLRPGDYIFDLAFTRVADGTVEYSGDTALKIIRETSRVG